MSPIAPRAARDPAVNTWLLYSAAAKHLEMVQKLIDQLIERHANDELKRLTGRLQRLAFRAEPEDVP
jgi:hypothetical protein